MNKEIISSNSLLEHSFVITVDEQRYSQFVKVFEYHNLFPLPIKFVGVSDGDDFVFNCYLSHKKAILKAKELNWPFVCIFEDDAYPCNDIRTYLDKVMANVPKHCKVISFGYNSKRDETKVNDLFDFSSTYGAHAYVVFQEAYEEYLERLDEMQVADMVFFTKDNDIHPLVVRKNLFLQYSSVNGWNGFISRGRSRVGMSESIAEKFGFPKPSDVIGKPSTGELLSRSVELNICQTCNWGCPSCNRFCDIFKESANDTIMTVDDVKDIVGQIKGQINVPKMTIIGGEPTLNPDCIDICKYVCENLDCPKIEIATNCSHKDVIADLSRIQNLTIRVDNESIKQKWEKHRNLYDVSRVKPQRDFDFTKCEEYKQCGIGIFKHGWKIRWFHCSHGQFIARLLGKEDEASAKTLFDLLHGDLDNIYKDCLCQNCYRGDWGFNDFKRNFGTVSPQFEDGYQAILNEAENRKKYFHLTNI